MPSLIEFIILGLATWRLGSLVQYERGPKGIFTRFRAIFGIGHDDEGIPTAWPETEIARLFECVWCGSVWVGFGMVGFYLLTPGIAIIMALPFALSAISIIVGVMINGKG
jgi:hypothetical protein